jgi:ArsR family transcriptional regulator, arsenate/arsenite/antimonite-responsive transcriptional repressor
MRKAANIRGKRAKTSAKIAGVDEKTLSSLIQVFKSLSDKSRLQILLILNRDGEQSVTSLCDQLDQTQPAVSHHLTQLRTAKLVAFRRDGKFNYYKIDSEIAVELLAKFYPGSKTGQQRIQFGDLEVLFKSK